MMAAPAELVDRGRRRRLERVERQSFHLVCPLCEWLVVPLEGLLGDRMLRLVEHLDDVHLLDPGGLPDWRLAMARHAAESGADPFYPTGSSW